MRPQIFFSRFRRNSALCGVWRIGWIRRGSSHWLDGFGASLRICIYRFLPIFPFLSETCDDRTVRGSSYRRSE